MKIGSNEISNIKVGNTPVTRVYKGTDLYWEASPDANPSLLTLTVISDTQIDLAWTETSTNEDGFKIERSTDGITYSVVHTTLADVTIYSNTGLTANITYYYKVKAYKGGTYSEYTSVVSDTTWTTEYKIVHDSLTTKPSQTIANAQATLVKTLVDNGIWATRDTLYLFAQTTNTNSEALINWINPGTYNATIIGSPTFTAMEGFKGDASTAAINTNFNASIGTNKMKSADVGVSMYINEATTTNTHILWGCNDRFLWQKAGLVRIKESSGESTTTLGTTGVFHFIRDGVGTKAIYDNGIQEAGTTAIDPAFENYNFYILARSGTSPGYSNAEVSYFSLGGKLTPAQVVIERDAVDKYLNSTEDIIIDTSVYLNSYLYVVEDINSYNFNIRLRDKPSDDVTVNISARNSLLDFSSAVLTFTPLNYLITQSVTVNGNNNPTNDQGISTEYIDLSLSSADISYDGQTQSSSVKVAATELNIENYDPLPPPNTVMTKFDVVANYNFTTEGSLSTLRQNLINAIWIDGLPAKATPDDISIFTSDTYFNPQSSNLNYINLLRWDIPEGFTSYVYHCIPTTSNNKCIFMPFGHGGSWNNLVTFGNDALITQLLDDGYDVICGYMVTYGPNAVIKNNPAGHDFTAYEDPGIFNPMELFLDHWVYTLNYIKANFSFSELSMIGHSGGGWTTVFMSACFTDFVKSFEIAGTLPLFARVSADQGDYEQGIVNTVPRSIIDICSYVDMYILASHNGQFCQIHNPTDQFFKALPKYHQLYDTIIQNTLTSFSQSYSFIYEEYTYAGHKITQDCIDIIFNYL